MLERSFRAAIIVAILVALLPSAGRSQNWPGGIPLEVINNTPNKVWVTFYYAGNEWLNRHIIAAGWAEPNGGAFRTGQKTGNLTYWARAEVMNVTNPHQKVCDTTGMMWKGSRYKKLLTWHINYNPGKNCWLS